MLDSDQLSLRSLDSLFELPEVDLAAPRAFWIDKGAFASTLMLITLSDRLWEKINAGMQMIEGRVYDMDLVNNILGDTVLMLPGNYVTLNSHFEDWNLPNWFGPEAKFRHTGIVDRTKEEDMEELLHAINVLLSTDKRYPKAHQPPNCCRDSKIQRRELEFLVRSMHWRKASLCPRLLLL